MTLFLMVSLSGPDLILQMNTAISSRAAPLAGMTTPSHVGVTYFINLSWR